MKLSAFSGQPFHSPMLSYQRIPQPSQAGKLKADR